MAVIGNLQDIALSGLIQITCQQGDSATLHLSQADNWASIYFVEGNIVHARLGELIGEEAFYKLLEWHEGQFELHQGSDPAQQSIFNHWSNLLLEGYSNLDESNIQAMENGSSDLSEPHETALYAETTALTDSHTPFLETPTATNLDEAKNLLQNLAQEIPGFIAASIVQEDGIGLCQHSHHREDNATLISNQALLTMKVVEMLNDSPLSSPIQNVLITSTESTLIVEPLNSHLWLGLLIAPHAPSGHARLVMKDFAPHLAATLS
jgi:predicted regulator of Ras-like GTPase activity (Roadblock/LC7/MglB family)